MLGAWLEDPLTLWLGRELSRRGIRVADLVARGRYPHQRAFNRWSRHDEAAVLHHQPPVCSHRGIGQEEPLVIAGSIGATRLGVVPDAHSNHAGPVPVVGNRREPGEHRQFGVDADVELPESITIARNEIRETREPMSRVGVRIGEKAGDVELTENRIDGYSVAVSDLRQSRT